MKNRLNQTRILSAVSIGGEEAPVGIQGSSISLVIQEPFLFSSGNMTVTHFSIEYDSINSKNTFTNGDTITGRVIVEVTKDTTINSLVFIGKGEARVRWSEHYGQYQHHVYWQNEKYYEVKHYLLRATRQDGKTSHFPVCPDNSGSSFHVSQADF